jgi:predicted TIM-barrel fold metal-dependent hydrolase
MFGTNYPMIQPDECLGGVADLDLDEDTQEQFLWRNTATVFGVDTS